MNAVAVSIRAAREATGLNRAQAALRLGMAYRQLQRYEFGENSPSLETAINMADTFGVSLDALVGREQAKTAG